MLEVFVDDFVQLAQTTDEKALRHCSRAVLHGIHSMFPPPNATSHNGADPVSIKKLLKGKGVWLCCPKGNDGTDNRRRDHVH